MSTSTTIHETRYERVDRNVWRFLLATFGTLVVILLGLISFLGRSYMDAQKAQSDNNRAQDIAITQVRTATEMMQQQNAAIVKQLGSQQDALAGLTATVAALHDDVVELRGHR